MPYSSQTQQKLCRDIIATILDGDTESNAVAISGTTMLAFITDANLNATSFTFLVSDALDGTYLPLKNMGLGNVVTSFCSANSQYATNANDFASAEYFKFVANAPQSGSDTEIILVTRTIA